MDMFEYAVWDAESGTLVDAHFLRAFTASEAAEAYVKLNESSYEQRALVEDEHPRVMVVLADRPQREAKAYRVEARYRLIWNAHKEGE